MPGLIAGMWPSGCDGDHIFEGRPSPGSGCESGGLAGFRASGLGFRASGAGFGILGSRVHLCLGSWVKVSGSFRCWILHLALLSHSKQGSPIPESRIFVAAVFNLQEPSKQRP